MVSKITIFEPHIDHLTVGPLGSGSTDHDENASSQTAVTGARKRSKRRIAGGILLLIGTAVGVVAFRRSRMKPSDSEFESPSQPELKH